MMSPKFSLFSALKSKTARAVVGGAPKSNTDADSSSGGTSSGEEESETSAPSLVIHSTHSRQASPLPRGPMTSMEAYGFELHEPSIRDSLLYDRYMFNVYLCKNTDNNIPYGAYISRI